MPTKYNLFLDDNREPHQAFLSDGRGKLIEVSGIHSWVIARDYDEFCFMIKAGGCPEAVSFDHDLCFAHIVHYHDETRHSGFVDYFIAKKTGKHAAEFLVQYCKDNGLYLPLTYVHSANASGAQNIQEVLDSYSYGRS